MRPCFLWLLALVACTDAGLQPYAPPAKAALDDQLAIEANVCTSPAEDAVFPVKILFLVDNSDSMSVTDRGGLRAQAVAQVLNRFAGNPAVEFAVIGFGANIDNITDGFTPTPDVAEITQRLLLADHLTDYQGALSAAYQVLSLDMLETSPAERARTKYVVIFFSDGVADPRCSSELGFGQDLFFFCDVDRQDWQAQLSNQLDPAMFADLDKGGDYNQPAQILDVVDDIVQLQDVFRVGEVRLHTGFLFDPAAATDPLAVPFRLDRQGGIDILTQVAEHGGGTFTEFSSATTIDFLNINYATVRQPNAMAAILATNRNARLAGDLLEPDTDGDGLPDALEFELKTCVGLGSSQSAGQSCTDPTDSDGDGYSDAFEYQRTVSGFAPLDRTKPSQPCTARRDSDGDGLRDCEELFLGTDARLFDSDGDRLTDGLEVSMGLSPLDTRDALEDADHDGVRNADELRRHLDPLNISPTALEDDHYLYEIAGTETRADGRTCYDLNVRNITLLSTGQGTNSPRGENYVFVDFIEAPSDRPLDFGELRIACIKTRYLKGVVKSPASGVVELVDDNFKKATQLDLARDCVGADDSGSTGR